MWVADMFCRYFVVDSFFGRPGKWICYETFISRGQRFKGIQRCEIDKSTIIRNRLTVAQTLLRGYGRKKNRSEWRRIWKNLRMQLKVMNNYKTLSLPLRSTSYNCFLLAFLKLYGGVHHTFTIYIRIIFGSSVRMIDTSWSFWWRLLKLSLMHLT